MKSAWVGLLAWCLLLANLGPAASAAPPTIYRKGQTRIMPMGDSITNAAGWRIYLQELLRDKGYTFRMVGGRNDPLQPEGTWSEHGGCGGWTIGSFPISQEFGGADVDWLHAQPDLVLLMIGTNDMQWGQNRGAAERLSGLFDKIWADVPQAAILVAQITPFAHGGRINDKPDGHLLDPLVRDYNAAIADLVARKREAGKRVAIVDQYRGFDAGKDLSDKCHPNERGHRKMARKWMEAIEAITVKDHDYPDRDLPPIVDARVDGQRSKTITVGDRVRLTGKLVDVGGKGPKITFQWRKLCGPGAVTFAAPHKLATEAEFSAAGSYCLALFGTSGKLSGHGNVRVVVNKASGAGDDFRPGKPGRVISISLGTALRPDDAAGVIARPHWNQVKLRESAPGLLENLTDDSGKATKARFRFWANNGFPASNAGCPDSPDGRLLSGRYGATNPGNTFLRDIPFRHYDLYLYFYDAGGNKPGEAEFVHRFEVRDEDTSQTIAGPLFARNRGGPFTKWVRAASNQVTDQKAPPANYLVLADLGVPNLLIQSGGEGPWSRTSLCGIQIVEHVSDQR